ncbi:hypothetical protein AOQ84DRAFT_222161 [Glonium stellatum]|uniref:Uncharacterized protein n=1 Tax=Glonium stellatum TaxID=574774 RepID=A0A8E2F063_9PEZI|nr:hypothetical protein AOQ84DRAFT_222161 [Glonium stellatum]
MAASGGGDERAMQPTVVASAVGNLERGVCEAGDPVAGAMRLDLAARSTQLPGAHRASGEQPTPHTPLPPSPTSRGKRGRSWQAGFGPGMAVLGGSSPRQSVRGEKEWQQPNGSEWRIGDDMPTRGGRAFKPAENQSESLPHRTHLSAREMVRATGAVHQVHAARVQCHGHDAQIGAVRRGIKPADHDVGTFRHTTAADACLRRAIEEVSLLLT